MMNKHEYLDAPGISQSALGWFEVSPEYYKYMMSQKQTGTREMGLGSALHYLVFEPDNFDDYMVVMDRRKMPFPDSTMNKKENKEWRDEIITRAAAGNLEVVEWEDFEQAKRMRDKLYSVTESRELLEYKLNEFEKASQWEWDGLLFKRKVDVTSDLFLIDLKSTNDASNSAVSRQIYDRRIYRQLGMYADGERILEGSIFLKETYIIAIENKPPFGVSVHKITEDYLEKGIVEYRNLARKLAECARTDSWPTYTSMTNGGIQIVDVPNWLKND